MPVGSRANELLSPVNGVDATTDIVPSSATCRVFKDPLLQVKYAICPCALKVNGDGLTHVESDFELRAVSAPVLLSIEYTSMEVPFVFDMKSNVPEGCMLNVPEAPLIANGVPGIGVTAPETGSIE